MKITETGIPKLDLINKMALLRDGNVPVPIIVLVGSEQNLKEVLKLESAILTHFLVINTENDLKASLLNSKGMIHFVSFTSEKKLNINEPYEIIHVDSFFNWNAFFQKLKLDGATEDLFSDFTFEMKSELKKNCTKILTQVLYAHYKVNDDNKITDADVKMIRDLASKNLNHENVQKSVTIAKSEKSSDSKNDSKNGTERKDASSANTLAAKIVRARQTEFPASNDSTKHNKNEHDETDSIERDEDNSKNLNAEDNNENDEMSDVPKPTETINRASKIITKEELTKEEEKENERLLNELCTLYKSTIQFMTESCNAQYRIIINKMQDCLDTITFKQQFTKMYLDVSNDTGSELYKRLYDIDEATQRFQKTVIHQIKPLACYNCGAQWKEDITFLPKGIHSVRCPHCYNDYPFEKV